MEDELNLRISQDNIGIFLRTRCRERCQNVPQMVFYWTILKNWAVFGKYLKIGEET
jgi:hypothetical protein